MNSKKTIIMTYARGKTLFELLMVMAVIAVVLSVGAPALSSFIDKQRLTGACHEVYQYFQYARSSAVRVNRGVSLSFYAQPFAIDTDADGVAENYLGCLALSDNSKADCNCAGSPAQSDQCRVGGQSQVLRFSKESGVGVYQADAKFGSTSKTTFGAQLGTAVAGRVTLASNHWSCRIVLSSLGRVRFAKNKEGQFIVPVSVQSTLQ